MSQENLQTMIMQKFGGGGGKRGVLWDCANFKAKTSAASDGVLQTRNIDVRNPKSVRRHGRKGEKCRSQDHMTDASLPMLLSLFYIKQISSY